MAEPLICEIKMSEDMKRAFKEMTEIIKEVSDKIDKLEKESSKRLRTYIS